MKKILSVSLLMFVHSAFAFKDCPECPEMVILPDGSFMMGSTSQNNSQDNEKPQHLVYLKSFSIGKYEVTQEEWFAVMGNNPSSNKDRSLPVENVSWDDANLFAEKLAKKTGKKYRLPTEAEWEYAARGLSTTIYPWGNSDDELSNYAWFSANTDATNPAGQKRPNEFGLHDMLGNVWEWTQDCWNPNYINAPSDGSAWISNECSERVLRGGSWDNDSQGLRVAIRSGFATDFRYNVIGLRVAMTP
jgi:formylglycine-generating enzyme required for sulfatase activity